MVATAFVLTKQPFVLRLVIVPLLFLSSLIPKKQGTEVSTRGVCLLSIVIGFITRWMRCRREHIGEVGSAVLFDYPEHRKIIYKKAGGLKICCKISIAPRIIVCGIEG